MTVDNYTNQVIHGDSLEVLKEFPSDSINLIITSPLFCGACA